MIIKNNNLQSVHIYELKYSKTLFYFIFFKLKLFFIYIIYILVFDMHKFITVGVYG